MPSALYATRKSKGDGTNSYARWRRSSVSDSDRADLVAFHELEQLVHKLSEELAGFRRRALQAESRLRDVEGAGAPGATTLDRLDELERENADLRVRLQTAS